MNCPECHSARVKVVMTTYATTGEKVRRRHCLTCDHRWYTLQQPETILLKTSVNWLEVGGHRKTVKLVG